MDFTLFCLIFTSGLSMGFAVGILVQHLSDLGEQDFSDPGQDLIPHRPPYP
jgi:hypothetical protein